MANHSATKKAIRKTITKTAVNKNQKTRIKTYIKRVLSSVKSGSLEEANKALIEAQSEIMRGVANKILKKNTGSRKVSRLASKVKAISAESSDTLASDDSKKPVAKAKTKAVSKTAKVAKAKK